MIPNNSLLGSRGVQGSAGAVSLGKKLPGGGSDTLETSLLDNGSFCLDPCHWHLAIPSKASPKGQSVGPIASHKHPLRVVANSPADPLETENSGVTKQEP